MKITISKEDYLKTIAEAESEDETVIGATLVRWLRISPPAVTAGVRRLKRDGLVKLGRNGRISLTAPGREIASHLLNRHHLIERMLAEIFGMEWYKVHDEAERLADRVAVLRTRLVAIDSPDALRTRLFGSRVRIGLADQADRFATTLQADGVADVRVEGSAISVAILHGVRTPALVRRLIEAGAEIESVALEEPPLEEVYLRLLHQEDDPS